MIFIGLLRLTLFFLGYEWHHRRQFLSEDIKSYRTHNITYSRCKLLKKTPSTFHRLGCINSYLTDGGRKTKQVESEKNLDGLKSLRSTQLSLETWPSHMSPISRKLSLKYLLHLFSIYHLNCVSWEEISISQSRFWR